MLAAVKGGYELVTNGVEFEGAYRAKDKDLLRALARDLEQKDPWVLLSRPMKEADGFVEQSLSERASERRARKFRTSCWALPCSAACCSCWQVLAGTKLRLPWQLCCAWAHRFLLP